MSLDSITDLFRCCMRSKPSSLRTAYFYRILFMLPSLRVREFGTCELNRSLYERINEATRFIIVRRSQFLRFLDPYAFLRSVLQSMRLHRIQSFFCKTTHMKATNKVITNLRLQLH